MKSCSGSRLLWCETRILC